MRSQQTGLFGQPSSYRLAFVVSLIAYALVQMKTAPGFFADLQVPDNDDAMRLVAVRDFVAGQGWFDTIQHRATPPEGLSLHWSRLVDVPLALLFMLFSLVLPSKAALTMAAAVWPAGLFVLYLALVGRVARSAFGYSAASFAVMGASVIPALGGVYFSLGRVDHHNLQILCMFAIFAAVIAVDRPFRAGAIAGVVAALSLAIGLEAIVFIAAAGLILTALVVMGTRGTAERLRGFVIAMGLAAPVLFAAQTAPAEWGTLYCDQLSGRVLAITTAALIYGVVLTGVREKLPGAGARLVVAVGLAIVVLAALWPVLGPCRAGPYSNLPIEIREGLIGRLIEAHSAAALFFSDPSLAFQVLGPLYTVMTFSVVFWIQRRTEMPAAARGAAGVALMFMAVGVLGSMHQSRGFIWGLAVMPVGFGMVMAWLTNGAWHRWRPLQPLVAAMFAVLVVAPSVPAGLVPSPRPPAAGQAVAPAGPAGTRLDGACLQEDRLAPLNALPTGLVLAPLNFGPRILLHTSHSVAAAPYHRSPDALTDGYLVFTRPLPQIADRIRAIAPDYVVVCAGQRYGVPDSFGSRLAEGQAPPWLERVTDIPGPLVVYRLRQRPQMEAGDDG